MKKLDKTYISMIVVLILYNIGITIALSIRATDLINENTEYRIKADSLDKEINVLFCLNFSLSKEPLSI